MDLGGLDLNLLVALDALFAEKSVSRAGERLHLSQSATSGALARLREVFGDPLLVPVGRRMVMTPVAEALVEPVRNFLLQAEAILNNHPVFDPGSSTRKFRILMSDYVETVLLAEALPRIEQSAPGIRFEFISNMEGGFEALDREKSIYRSLLPSDFRRSILLNLCSKTTSFASCGPGILV